MPMVATEMTASADPLSTMARDNKEPRMRKLAMITAALPIWGPSFVYRRFLVILAERRYGMPPGVRRLG